MVLMATGNGARLEGRVEDNTTGTADGGLGGKLGLTAFLSLFSSAK